MLDNCHEFPLINTNYRVNIQSNAITLYMFFYRSFLKQVQIDVMKMEAFHV